MVIQFILSINYLLKHFEQYQIKKVMVNAKKLFCEDLFISFLKQSSCCLYRYSWLMSSSEGLCAVGEWQISKLLFTLTLCFIYIRKDSIMVSKQTMLFFPFELEHFFWVFFTSTTKLPTTHVSVFVWFGVRFVCVTLNVF